MELSQKQQSMHIIKYQQWRLLNLNTQMQMLLFGLRQKLISDFIFKQLLSQYQNYKKA